MVCTSKFWYSNQVSQFLFCRITSISFPKLHLIFQTTKTPSLSTPRTSFFSTKCMLTFIDKQCRILYFLIGHFELTFINTLCEGLHVYDQYSQHVICCMLQVNVLFFIKSCKAIIYLLHLIISFGDKVKA